MLCTYCWDSLGPRQSGAESCVRVPEMSFIDLLCHFAKAWPEVPVLLCKAPNLSPLCVIQSPSCSLLAAEINAPTRQMNPEGIEASNREK